MRSTDAGLAGGLEAFGSRIAVIRKLHGLSRLEMADIAGLHVNTVVNLERGFVDGSILAVSLLILNLGCEGVAVTGSGFEPIVPAANRIGNVFPGLTTNKALMAAEIGEVVRRRRLDLGATLEQIASRAGIHRNTLSNVEKGLVAPSIATTYRIYRSLDVSCVSGSNSGIRLLA